MGLRLLMRGEEPGGHQCLDQGSCLSLPRTPPFVILSSRNMDSQFSVSFHRWLLNASVEKDTIPQFSRLFQGTAQLSQNPFALFLKQWERHLMGSLGSGVNLGPTTVAGVGAGTIKALGAQGYVWGLSTQKMGELGLAGQLPQTMSATKEEDFQRQGSGAVFTTPNNHTGLTTGF